MAKELNEAGKQLEDIREELATVTIYDQLTGCFNEKFFRTELEHHIALARRQKFTFCIGLVSINAYSEIFDKHGKASADDVLKTFGRILQQALREVDFVGHFGDEKFAVLLSGTDDTNMMLIFERFVNYTKQMYMPEDSSIEFTISAGFTRFEEEKTSENLFAEVEHTLKLASERGGNIAAVHGNISTDKLGGSLTKLD